jgi:phage/plasmid-associated DNA primase
LQLMVYPESAAMRTLRTHIEVAGDSVKTWIQEECVLEPSIWTASKALYDAYTSYCASHGHRMPIGFERFTAALLERDPTLTPRRERYVDVLRGTRRQVRGVLGIRLRTDADPELADGTPLTSSVGQPHSGSRPIDAWLP